jgi:spore germination protein GerM
MNARLRSVTIAGDLVTIDYHVPGDDWGVNGSASLRALVEQLVFTASEEPGIVRVLITQNGARVAVIGGEGLIIDRPQTRRGLLGS